MFERRCSNIKTIFSQASNEKIFEVYFFNLLIVSLIEVEVSTESEKRKYNFLILLTIIMVQLYGFIYIRYQKVLSV